ncbi:MAG: hypothetical protein SFZ03_05080 [Candidatus Melainabacteria bacterium]|nr:hypothetical protein [Candidatus Melainabacteria bacterium]
MLTRIQPAVAPVAERTPVSSAERPVTVSYSALNGNDSVHFGGNHSQFSPQKAGIWTLAGLGLATPVLTAQMAMAAPQIPADVAQHMSPTEIQMVQKLFDENQLTPFTLTDGQLRLMDRNRAVQDIHPSGQASFFSSPAAQEQVRQTLAQANVDKGKIAFVAVHTEQEMGALCEALSKVVSIGDASTKDGLLIVVNTAGLVNGATSNVMSACNEDGSRSFIPDKPTILNHLVQAARPDLDNVFADRQDATRRDQLAMNSVQYFEKLLDDNIDNIQVAQPIDGNALLIGIAKVGGGFVFLLVTGGMLAAWSKEYEKSKQLVEAAIKASDAPVTDLNRWRSPDTFRAILEATQSPAFQELPMAEQRQRARIIRAGLSRIVDKAGSYLQDDKKILLELGINHPSPVFQKMSLDLLQQRLEPKTDRVLMRQPLERLISDSTREVSAQGLQAAYGLKTKTPKQNPEAQYLANQNAVNEAARLMVQLTDATELPRFQNDLYSGNPAQRQVAAAVLSQRAFFEQDPQRQMQQFFERITAEPNEGIRTTLLKGVAANAPRFFNAEEPVFQNALRAGSTSAKRAALAAYEGLFKPQPGTSQPPTVTPQQIQNLVTFVQENRHPSLQAAMVDTLAAAYRPEYQSQIQSLIQYDSGNPSEDRRVEAVGLKTLLRHTNEALLAPMFEYLESDTSYNPDLAARVAVKSVTEAVRSELTDVRLGSAKPAVRYATAAAIGKLGQLDDLPRLIEQLKFESRFDSPQPSEGLQPYKAFENAITSCSRPRAKEEVTGQVDVQTAYNLLSQTVQNSSQMMAVQATAKALTQYDVVALDPLIASLKRRDVQQNEPAATAVALAIITVGAKMNFGSENAKQNADTALATMLDALRGTPPNSYLGRALTGGVVEILKKWPSRFADSPRYNHFTAQDLQLLTVLDGSQRMPSEIREQAKTVRQGLANYMNNMRDSSYSSNRYAFLYAIAQAGNVDEPLAKIAAKKYSDLKAQERRDDESRSSSNSSRSSSGGSSNSASI